MDNLDCLLVCTLGNFLASVLVAAHTVNNLDLGDEQGYEDKGYESNWKNFFPEFFVPVDLIQKIFDQREIQIKDVFLFIECL